MERDANRRGDGPTWAGLLLAMSSLVAVVEVISRVSPEVDDGGGVTVHAGGRVPVEIATAVRSDIVVPDAQREIRDVALLVVPREAVVRARGGTAVLLYRSGRAIAASVRTGRENGTFTELLSGVREGDTVITAACGPIGDGSAARVVEEGFPGSDNISSLFTKGPRR